MISSKNIYSLSSVCFYCHKGADMVVSMRPYSHGDAIQSSVITSRYPRVHGSPIHIGDPNVIGISKSLKNPDFGDPVTINEVISNLGLNNSIKIRKLSLVLLSANISYFIRMKFQSFGHAGLHHKLLWKMLSYRLL